MENRSGGFYSPSAGAIYPTLQLLEDRGWVSVEVVEGKKIYTISDSGRQALSEYQERSNGFPFGGPGVGFGFGPGPFSDPGFGPHGHRGPPRQSGQSGQSVPNGQSADVAVSGATGVTSGAAHGDRSAGKLARSYARYPTRAAM